MTKSRRNDPCPCGSGKKYKKCCLVSAEDADFQYRRWRQIEAGLIPRVMNFAFETLGPTLLEDAWNDFNVGEAVEAFDPASPMNMVFMPWFLFTWRFELKPEGSGEFLETTIAEQFLIHDLDGTTADEQSLLLSANRCPYTLCEVVEVTPGVGMTQFDLLRRIKYEVIERSASQGLKRGEIIFCATTEVAGIRSNMGTSPYALRPTAKRDVLELRKWMLDEIGGEKITAEHLHEFEYDIRALYLNILRGMFTPPRLANTDNDPFVPQKLYFDLESADKAFHGLKGLAGGNENDLLEEATVIDGLIVKADISWLGGSEVARKRLGGPVLLGLLRIYDDRLVVEVNSKERAELIRRIVEERLGDSAKYKTTLIEPIEPRLNEMWRAAAAGGTGPLSSRDARYQRSSDFASPAEADPDLRALMEETARQHWESWSDLPVPALNDMTPREAVKTEEGRDLLESLLLLYEHHEDSADNVLSPDVSALRRELGMD